MSSSLFEDFFKAKKWQPSQFQCDVGQALLAGDQLLISAPTGEGKTAAAFLPLVEMALAKQKTLLWISPLKSLASDTAKSLRDIVDTLALDIEVMVRTGDTTSRDKKKILTNKPTVLITTPESLHLMLSLKTAHPMLANIYAVVVDEWHELLSTKRGVQASLGVASLYQSFGVEQVCAISATLSDHHVAARYILPISDYKTIVSTSESVEDVIVLTPDEPTSYSWRGHLGLKMVPRVLTEVAKFNSVIIFVNTRAMAEFWYQSICERASAHDLTAKDIEIHHSSIDKDKRLQVEKKLKAGSIKVVIATSSLDLGLDFGTIDAVFQIGSTKSVTRLRQRAGRANHRPGENPTIFLVPTYSLEEFEFKALKNLLGRNELDPINMIPQQPLDVAVQFVVTRACARTKKSQLLTEIESSGYYQSIDNKFFETLMNLVVNGGNSLARYEQFKHVQIKGDMISIASKRHAMRHRFIIGTIEGGQNYRVRQGRRSIGSIEESFAAKLQPGDKFQLGGKFYVVDSIYNTELKVRRSKSSDGFVPRWSGSRLRQSDIIAAELRRVISTTNISDNYLLQIQHSRSVIPRSDQLLIEAYKTREGFHLVIITMAAREINEQIAGLISYRWLQKNRATVSFTANNYGFELLSKSESLWNVVDDIKQYISSDNLTSDLLQSQNQQELAKRRFASIARIGGLLFPGFPWQPKRYSHLTGSADMLYEALETFEPDHPYLQQARLEVLNYDIDINATERELQRLEKLSIVANKPDKISPFAFPIIAERLRSKLSSESFIDRINRYRDKLESVHT